MSNPGSSSLRPAWKGGRGFQPPPTVTSEGPASTRGRSSSIASKDSNKFSALGDDDDDFISVSGKKSRDRDRHNNNNSTTNKSSNNDAPKVNSRGEAFRSSYTSGGGRNSKGGRSLADLASKVPEGVPRSSSTGYTGEERGGPRGRRYSTGDPTIDDDPPQRSSEPSAYRKAVEAANVIQYTREKLLALRPRPAMDLGFPPPHLKHVEAPALFSELPQDPVCWDTFDADAIWAEVSVRRPSAPPLKPGEVPAEKRRSYTSSTGQGRWQRGQALPDRRKEKEDASNPDDLWDDPIGGATGAAMDFSAFGDTPEGGGGGGDAFDFDKMAEASRELEEELHGPQDIDGSGGSNHVADGALELKVDAKRPLATVGTQIRSGSGDNVNVFEDFDDPAANDGGDKIEQPALEPGSAGGEDPSASSRLMAMIGVKKGEEGRSWNGSAPAEDAGLLGLGGAAAAGLSLNPWGGPAPQQENVGLGMDLASRLESFAAEQKEAEQKELLRRRQEQEEAQRRAMAQRQQQQQQQQAQQDRARQQSQQQQQPSPQSQVEAVLMERISTILENSWGRSDLGSILSTLHSEDSRVIPLLGSVELLRDLIAHNPRRVALRQDPAFGAEMAVLQMTNAQWSQHEAQVRAQQEQEAARRREEQIRMESIQHQRSMSSDGGSGPPRINPEAPWFYSDPQGNIQGPFRGDEMRQWLEAGYFKGDLPISQQAGGPFIALSVIFQDLNVAFKTQTNDRRAKEEAEARARAEEEHMLQQRRKAEEAEREREQQARQQQANEQARREQEAVAAAQREQQEREAAAAAAAAVATNGANQPSAQLKMMLGVSQQASAAVKSASEPPAEIPEKRSSKSDSKNNQAPSQGEIAAAKPAAPAWGGAAQTAPPSRKSMSEIQKEEARRAATVAAQQGGQGRQSSSGWANVAATAGGAWAPGAVKPTAAAGGTMPASRNSTGSQSSARSKVTAPARKSSGGQPQQVSTSGSNTAAEEFGASMSPALEKWCKDQMKKINGTDDLTLVSFCMTLDDASEIRQYLTTYLGSNAQVNKFATEFINKKGGAPPKADEWETTGSAKKGKKKKGTR